MAVKLLITTPGKVKKDGDLNLVGTDQPTMLTFIDDELSVYCSFTFDKEDFQGEIGEIPGILVEKAAQFSVLLEQLREEQKDE